MASAVPQEPAPSTTHVEPSIAAAVASGATDMARLVDGGARRPRSCLLLLSASRGLRKQSIEVHRRQQERREAALHQQIGNDLTRIGQEIVRAENAEQS